MGWRKNFLESINVECAQDIRHGIPSQIKKLYRPTLRTLWLATSGDGGRTLGTFRKLQPFCTRGQSGMVIRHLVHAAPIRALLRLEDIVHDLVVEYLCVETPDRRLGPVEMQGLSAQVGLPGN